MQTVIDTLPCPADTNSSTLKVWAVRLLPSLTDFAFLLPLFVLFGILPGSQMLLSDADMGWHLRTGEWILDHGRVPVQDLFSFTKSSAPWFAWEWGWDLLFGTIHTSAGLAGVAAVNVAILGLVCALGFRLIRRACRNDLVAFVLTGFAVCGSTIHWLARPHLTSWLFFLLFAHCLASAAQGKHKQLLILPCLTVLWTNMHGSFFLGLLMIAIPALAPWVDWALDGSDVRSAWLRSRPYAVSCALCSAATLLNPYGWQLHRHVIQYLRDGKQMDLMQEFQSVNFHHAPAPFFEPMLLAGVAALLWAIQRRRWTDAMTILLWAHLALFAVRNVPMYLFLCAPAIGCMVDEGLRSQTRVTRWVMKRFEGIATEFQPIERMVRFYLVAGTAFAFIAWSIAVGAGVFRADFDNTKFPHSALPVIDSYHPQRVFSTDQWSAYLIYQRYPKLKVFVDDRSDFYGADMLDRVTHILNARWDWEADLLRFSTDMVIVAPTAPVATVLKSSPRWQLLLDDKQVVVFARKPIVDTQTARQFLPARESSAVANNGGNKPRV